MLKVWGSVNSPLISVKLLNMIMRPEDIKIFLNCVDYMGYEFENKINFNKIVVLCENLEDGIWGRAIGDRILLDYDVLNHVEMSKTYIHEAIHHLQYQKMILTKNKSGCLEWYGDGESYRGLKWSERPWERHAVEMTDLIWRDFKKRYGLLTTAKEICDCYSPMMVN